MDWWLDARTPQPFGGGALLRATLADAKVEGANWDIAVRVFAGRTRLIIGALDVQPTSDTEFIAFPGIEGALVFPGGQRLSLAQVRREITAMIKRDLVRAPETSNWPATWRLALGFWGPDLQAPRPGRKGHDAYDHALIAAAYVEARHRDPNSVYKAMLGPLQATGKRYHLSSLPKAVSNARLLGYLTDAPAKGQAGGELTEQALSVLEEARFDGFPPVDDRVPTTPPKRRETGAK